jgi:hypothetical protein
VKRLLLCAVATAALPATSAVAAPPFPHTFHGTIAGTRDALDKFQGTRTKASWTIKGVALRLQHVQKTDASWEAVYVATAGTIRYQEAETGSCSYSFQTKSSLRKSLSSSSAPFALSQSLFFKHPTHALGEMRVDRTFKVAEVCPQPDGEAPLTEKRTISLPPLFNVGEPVVKLGRRVAGHNTERDTFKSAPSTTRWNWVLKPGR